MGGEGVDRSEGNQKSRETRLKKEERRKEFMREKRTRFKGVDLNKRAPGGGGGGE